MYVCGVPRNLDAFARVMDVEQSLFGDLALSPQASREIYKMRPDIYTAVFCPAGSVAAYLTAYPLRPQFAEALIDGGIAEPDLTPDMLLTHGDQLEGACVYIGSVVVDNKFDPILKSILLISLAQFRLHQLRNAEVKKFAAIMTAASKEGERLAQRIGAQKLNDGANRKDGLDVYGRQFNRGFLYQASAAVERFFNNKMVRLDLDSDPTRPVGEPIELAPMHAPLVGWEPVAG
jgi:hypothetical protein